jgi:chromosome segregation protein
MKLRKLILSGFKSFADRTEFDFDEGVSCVVGPNGCGKSNIVDAVKWVFGEQSAKSLRGSEMADVIFNGSATRRAGGMAEVTLVFDNDGSVLAPTAATRKAGEPKGANGAVSVTRRLYRSGQSDYLINKAPCRLRDIREMFMDTGMGRHAYSLIEQGRVEAFLQASQDERRAVFDEAAGISKYKARKKEALRKLERVEQNLLRITDILSEVEKRLRSIKYQAGKARSYQTYSERLKELRSLFFLAQYHELRQRRSQLERDVDARSDALAAIHARIGQLEASRSSTEVEAVDLERAQRDCQGQIAAVGGQILTCEQRAEMLDARVKELGEQIVAAARRAEELEAKIERMEQEATGRRAEHAGIDAEASDLAARHEAAGSEHAEAEQELARLQEQLEEATAATIDLLRQSAQCNNEISAAAVRQENLRAQKDRLAARAGEIDALLADLSAEKGQVEADLAKAHGSIAAGEGQLAEARTASQRFSEEEQDSQSALAAAREQRSALQSRTDTLREMQQRLEGVTQGVRRVLEARRQGRLGVTSGMLGEFLETDVEHAAVVEAALAGADQCLVASRLSDVEAAAGQLARVLGDSGAVEILCLDRQGDAGDGPEAPSCPHAIARVIDWVRFPRHLAPAMRRMLGRTFVVARLCEAIAAAQTAPSCRFVTLAGEVLEADGRVRLGSANRGSGVIARTSELRQLRRRSEELERRISQLQEACRRARDQREQLQKREQEIRLGIYETNTQRVSLEGRLSRLDEQIARLEDEKPVLSSEIGALSEDAAAAAAAEQQARGRLADIEARRAARQQDARGIEERIASVGARRDELSERMTELKVCLAQAEQKKLALRDALAGLARQRGQMDEDLCAARSQIEQGRGRRSDAEEGIRASREEIDRLYARQQQLNREAEEVEESRRGLQEKLEQVRSRLAEQRSAAEEASGQVNAGRVELSEADVRIENLITRAADEMQMQLVELYGSYRHDEDRDWSAVEAEIRELRGKIERLGNVNLDAIAEQDELQQRREFLRSQLDDVTRSKNQLNELIRRINRESRQLFSSTFDEVRRNFHDLFRKLFGGGRADILLLDPDDVLESGIEIVARPPGKELRSLSLLSGGEKTMTALALLFSIFRARPSPFCLLDEVDAALDEPNTIRFSKLLQEFVDASQFIIITHAKRTMSMANVLYGVTMQEPGVSKRMSVRFAEAHRMAEPPRQPVPT